MKSEMERRLEKSSIKKPVPRDPNSPDIVVKVVCRYRAELFFKISRKTKLSRLFNAWTSRMEISSTLITPGGPGSASVESLNSNPNKPGAPSSEATVLKAVPPTPMSFIFTHMGRTIDPEQTAEEVGIESNDEILAVEMMDLTSPDDDIPETQKQKLRKNWTENPAEAKQTLDDIFNGVVRERLKDVLRQYELREKHFETVIRSKELEVLLSRARAEEQKQLAEGERQIATVAEAQNQQLRHQMEDMQNSQARLMDKLISCCREPTGERTQRLFAFLREELEKRGTKTPPDIPPTPSSTTTTAPVLGLDVPKAVRPSNGSNGLVAPLIPSNVPALVNGSSSVAG
ncbi:hypothetical protein FRC03_011535 [Tulasnella sp. 419]|nr:hypothetical protein FRC03_011535 [Tulasnella sp. 419]